MFRKFALTFIILLAAVMSLSATSPENGSVNYFTDLIDDREYAALLDTVFNDQGLEQALDDYKVLVNRITGHGYEPWMIYLSLSRACMIISRYATEGENKAVAKAYMNEADKLILKAEEYGAPESAAGVLKALSDSFWYLIDGSLSKGMGFTKKIDALWESHKEDFHVLLMAADRYLHSPGIAGGSRKKGLALFQEAEEIMKSAPTAVWDRFTILSGLAYGYWKGKDKELALYYAEEAEKIYTADENIREILKNLRK